MSTEHEWPNTAPGADTDWIELLIEDPDDEDYPTTKVRVNVSFMLSFWRCRFGSCPGVLLTGAFTDGGCCQIGVHVSREEVSHMHAMVKELTREDWDRFGYERPIRRVKRKDRDENDSRYHTEVVDGMCVFANRTGGPAGGAGCAFHKMALRKGIHPSETKPEICWSIPFATDETYDETHPIKTVTVTATPASSWGSTVVAPKHIGYWCTETPDAYEQTATSKPVYVDAEVELRKLLGDRIYETMATYLRRIMRRRYPMPGEAANGGKKLIPLLVKQRAEEWEKDGNTEALERSKEYLQGHGHIVLGD